MSVKYRIIPIGGGGGITPSGTLNVSENGTYSVIGYKYVTVEIVPQFSGFYMQNTSDQDGVFSITKSSSSAVSLNINYSLDLEHWSRYSYGDTVQVPAGSKIYLIGNNNYLNTGWSNWNCFYMNVPHIAAGNVVSLLSENFETWTNSNIQGKNYAFSSMFKRNDKITSIKDINFGNITELPERGCYEMCSGGCTSLEYGIDFSSITSAGGDCFEYMYDRCTALKEATYPNISTPSSSMTMGWLRDTGTGSADRVVYAPTGVTISTGADGIPSGWTRIDY